MNLNKFEIRMSSLFLYINAYLSSSLPLLKERGKEEGEDSKTII
jgi:hypothetical protein